MAGSEKPAGTPSAGSAGSAGRAAAPAKVDPGQAAPEIPGAKTPSRSAVVVAHVGTLSGPAGSALTPTAQGIQVWVKYVNNKDGLNGHEIKLLMYDDGGDHARHRAQVQDAIERQHAIAFLANTESLTGHGSVDYITAKRVPVIGSDKGNQYFYKSPMFFPQTAHGYAVMYLTIANAADQMVPAGKTKLGTAACAEAQACSDSLRVWRISAKELGFEQVFEAKVSIAQPDYTAECLAARNAGVQVWVLVLDQNSVGRLAGSCARQGYRPVFASIPPAIAPHHKDDPNLATTLIGATPTFPWFQSGTPATDEFQHALRTFGAAVSPAGGTAEGWVAGKLLERAAANLPEPPTSQAILDGLWSIKNDTLGGLTQPLTFVENQPAQPMACWFAVAIKNKAWTSLGGYKLRCRSTDYSRFET